MGRAISVATDLQSNGAFAIGKCGLAEFRNGPPNRRLGDFPEVQGVRAVPKSRDVSCQESRLPGGDAQGGQAAAPLSERAVVCANDGAFRRQQFAIYPAEVDRVGRHPERRSGQRSSIGV
jgi:hypothetical protein